MTEKKRRFENDLSSFRKDIDDMNISIQMQESQPKSSNELTQAEEKVDHLNKVKVKLEVTLGELEDSNEHEKKSRLDMDKQRRKIEADLKVTQEVVIDLERDKK